MTNLRKVTDPTMNSEDKALLVGVLGVVIIIALVIIAGIIGNGFVSATKEHADTQQFQSCLQVHPDPLLCSKSVRGGGND